MVIISGVPIFRIFTVVAQLVEYLTEESELPGLLPGPAKYFSGN